MSSEPLSIDIDIKRPMALLSRAKLYRIASRRLTNKFLPEIEKYRLSLPDLGDFPLHDSYQQGDRTITPIEISISKKYGSFIYSLAAFNNARIAIESGTGFGISGAYLLSALALKGGHLHTFEIAEYSSLAPKILSQVSDSFTVYNDSFFSFATAIDRSVVFDLAFIDAVHNSDNVVRSVKSLVGWMKPGGVIIIDDIKQNDIMANAWQTVAKHPMISLAARIGGRLGVLEVRPDSTRELA